MPALLPNGKTHPWEVHQIHFPHRSLCFVQVPFRALSTVTKTWNLWKNELLLALRFHAHTPTFQHQNFPSYMIQQLPSCRHSDTQVIDYYLHSQTPSFFHPQKAHPSWRSKWRRVAAIPEWFQFGTCRGNCLSSLKMQVSHIQDMLIHITPATEHPDPSAFVEPRPVKREWAGQTALSLYSAWTNGCPATEKQMAFCAYHLTWGFVNQNP